MYAVVKSGGKQYKVEEGQLLRLEKVSGEVGSPVKFDQVLMFADGEDIKIGQPVLDNVSVDGHIVEQGKAKKIIVFKYKRRKRYRRKQGHRQQYTAVLIDSINSKATRAPQSFKCDKTVNLGENCIILTYTNIYARMEFCSQLTYNNIAGSHLLAAKNFDTTPLRIAVATIF